MKLSNWNPVIDNETQKERIVSVLEWISRELSMNKENKPPDLLSGKAGIAIFWQYYYRHSSNSNFRNYSNKLFYESLDAISDVPLNHTFCTGVAGILWCFCHMNEIGAIDSDVEEIIGNEIDLFLLESSLVDLQKGNWDYLHGGIGSTIYFLNRSNNEFVKQTFQKIIIAIENIAVKTNNGIAWKDYKNNETEVYNLGLSHGAPSILVILARVLDLNVANEKYNEMLNSSVNWLLSKKNTDKSATSIFPTVISSEHAINSRLSWCYGDLGISIALYQVGVISKNKQWQDEAIEIALLSTSRTDLVNNHVRDTGLCHGTAGIAHIYNRFYNYTGIQKFKEASQYWISQTLIFFDSPIRLKVWRKDHEERPEYWSEELGILEGISGIGLALIASISKDEPKWDRILLLS